MELQQGSLAVPVQSPLRPYTENPIQKKIQSLGDASGVQEQGTSVGGRE